MKDKSHTLGSEYFEKVYKENPDPWNFEKSQYEKDKYLKTLECLPKEKYDRALEIGCSIGVLTSQLAERCHQLIAIDISQSALENAKKRLKESLNVTLDIGSIPDNLPDGSFDLIMMSEVGYYLSMEDLKKAKTEIKKKLNKGGDLIIVHWTHYVEDYPLSGDQVSETFLADQELRMVDQYRTEDYRLEVFSIK